jgi:FkbM family methyltransferase
MLLTRRAAFGAAGLLVVLTWIMFMLMAPSGCAADAAAPAAAVPRAAVNAAECAAWPMYGRWTAAGEPRGAAAAAACDVPSADALRRVIDGAPPGRPFMHCLGDAPPLMHGTRTAPPFCVALYPQHADPQRWSIATDGMYYERDVTGLFVWVLARAPRAAHTWVVDAGANVGWFAALAAARGHRVLAVEASPATVCKTAQTIAASGLADAVALAHVALGASAGMAMFHVDPANPGASRVGGTRSSARVPVAALADLVPPCVDVALLKLDVEGAETAALRGAMPLFARGQVQYMVVEVRPAADTPAVFAALGAHGYRVAEVRGAACAPAHAGWGADEWARYLAGARGGGGADWVWHRADLPAPPRLAALAALAHE